MAQGIWIHTDRQRMNGSLLGERRKRALRWIQGYCNHANMYVGHKKVKQVDTRCAKCGIRVRFNLKRTVCDARGSPTQAVWISRPNDTRAELERKVHGLNNISNGNQRGGHEGFVTALELMKEKRPRTMGGELD
jgi:ribosomal protein L37E